MIPWELRVPIFVPEFRGFPCRQIDRQIADKRSDRNSQCKQNQGNTWVVVTSLVISFGQSFQTFPVENFTNLSNVHTSDSCNISFVFWQSHYKAGHHSQVWVSRTFAHVTAFQVHKSSCTLTSDPTHPSLHRSLKEKHSTTLFVKASWDLFSVNCLDWTNPIFRSNFSFPSFTHSLQQKHKELVKQHRKMHTNVCEPGQFCLLHFSSSIFSVLLHGVPPYSGLGESHFRSRDRIPGPQVTLHSDQRPHSPQPPLTNRK